MEDRIRNALDINKISKEVTARGKFAIVPDLVAKTNVAVIEPAGSTPQNSQMYRSRVRTEPTNVTAPQFSAALWLRLEAMFQEMADCCIKVYALEKVLKMKKDTLSHTVFLDEAMKVTFLTYRETECPSDVYCARSWKTHQQLHSGPL